MSILMSVSGCETGQPAKATVFDDTGFMSLWSTYSHCHATNNFDELMKDAQTLTKAANRSLTQESFVLPLPGKIEKFVSTPAARFAVDVNAMAAACSLHAASVAVEIGKRNIAKNLLQMILNYHSQSQYDYYTLQAKALLSELETNVIELTLNVP